eukprot:g11769.t1
MQDLRLQLEQRLGHLTGQVEDVTRLQSQLQADVQSLASKVPRQPEADYESALRTAAAGICEILQGRQIKDLNLDETYEVSKKVALLCSQDLETHSKPVLFTSDFMLMEFAIDYFFGAGEGHIMSHFYTPELVKSWVDSLAEAGSLSDSMYYDLRTKDEWDALEAQKHALGLTKWKLLWIAGKTLGIDFLKKFASHRG